MDQKVEENQTIQQIPANLNLSGGLEILVQLAEKGDIDPWDIDIIDVTDKYLTALDKTPRENLLNAGRAIFYSSVLLRLKSDILLNISNETLLSSQQTENFFPEDDLLFNDENAIPLDLTKLESYIMRSSIGKQQRKRKITLTDLIFALQQAEEEEERRALRAKMRKERVFSIAMPDTPEDVLDIAQDEEVEDIADKIDSIIQEHLTDDKPISFTFLNSIVGYKAKSFLAILFLTHAKKIVIEQNQLYEEIYIYKSGVVIDHQELPSKAKASEEKPKRNILQKIKDKIMGKKKAPRNKVIEVTTEGDTVVDIKSTEESSEQVSKEEVKE